MTDLVILFGWLIICSSDIQETAYDYEGLPWLSQF